MRTQAFGKVHPQEETVTISDDESEEENAKEDESNKFVDEVIDVDNYKCQTIEDLTAEDDLQHLASTSGIQKSLHSADSASMEVSDILRDTPTSVIISPQSTSAQQVDQPRANKKSEDRFKRKSALLDKNKSPIACKRGGEELDPHSEDYLTACDISDLVNGSASRSEEQRDRLIAKGKPIPDVLDDVDSKMIRSFVERIPWLIYNVQIERYMCWPCLLFVRSGTIWCIDGETSIKQPQKFFQVLGVHQIGGDHLTALVQLRLKENQIKKALPTESQINDSIRINRRMLTLMLEVTCTLKRKCDNVNPKFDGYAEVVRLIGSYDPELNRLSVVSKDFAEDFISNYANFGVFSIEAAIKKRVQAELSAASFVSVILEDTSDFVDMSFVAVILRYVDAHGEIRERFVQFLVLDEDRSGRTVFSKFKKFLTEFALQTKLLAFTYSGTVVDPKDIAWFNKEVSTAYPKSKFFHHYEHGLMNLILQAMSHKNSCRQFLKTIANMVVFFESHPLAAAALMRIEKGSSATEGKVNSPIVENADFRNILVPLLIDEYGSILKIIDEMCSSPKDWSRDKLAELSSFSVALNISHQRFLICVVAEIMAAIKDFSNEVDTRGHHDQWKVASKKAILSLNKIITNTYGLFEALRPSMTSPLAGETPTDLAKRILFYDSVAVASDFIANYFKDLEFSLFELRTVALASAYRHDPRKVAATRLDIVTDDFTQLIAQTRFLDNYELVKDKSPMETLKFIIAHGLTTPLAEAAKFLRIQCTIPTKATKLPGPSTLSRLREYARNKKTLNFTDTLLWMEKDLLMSMEKEPRFFDDLIDNHFLPQVGSHEAFFKLEPKSN